MSAKFTYRKISKFLFIVFQLLTISALSQSSGPLGGSDGTYSMFPMNNQLYPRNVSTGLATIRFVGNITANQSNVRIRVWRDDDKDGAYEVGEEKTSILIGNSPISFDKSVTIPAELFTYRFQLAYSSGSYWLDRSNIVAGDAYYIQGQSNAEARPIGDPDGSGPLLSPDYNKANIDPIADINFVRVYGGAKDNYSKAWGIGNANNDAFQDFNVGQFGMRIAKRIIAEHGIPVCILNGAERGFAISQFQRDDANPTNLATNYGRELRRANEAGLTGFIRGLIWFQGEANSMTPYITTTSQYKTLFNSLYSDWEADYGLMSKYYMIQVRPGCESGASSPESILPIQEAQRELDNENPLMEIVSTNNLPKYDDDCHYYYETGYKVIGDRVFTLISRDFYNVPPPPNTLTPQPILAEFSAIESTGVANEITISFSQPADNLVIVGPSIASLMRLKGGTLPDDAGYSISSVNIVNTASSGTNNVLRIGFLRNGSQPNPSGISFLGQLDGPNNSSVVNGSGIGLINFDNLSLGIGILPTDPLNLRISASNGANTLKWEAENNPQFSYFVVQRSDNGTTFSDISKLQANSANGTGNYDFTDSKPNTIRNYYRIYAMKRDGKSVMSQVVAVNNRTSSTIGITVYPNPVRDRANVGVTVKKAGMASIQIYDGAGKLVSTRKISLQKGNNMFSAGEILDQSAGIYTIRVVTEDDVFNTRIVRVK